MKSNAHLLHPFLRVSLATLLLLSPLRLGAVDAVLTGSSYILPSKPAQKNFASNYLEVGPGMNAYLSFAFGTLPPGVSGAQIQKATLRLFVNKVSKKGVFSIYSVPSSWAETNLCYTNAPIMGANLEAVGQPVPVAYNEVVVDLTALTQDWVNGAETNYGIMLVSSNADFTFAGKQCSSYSIPPRLEITLGSVGATGPQGPQGAQGIQGPIGLTGPQGPQGVQGIAGPNGIDGAVGAQGPQGLQGAQGPAGVNGTNGNTLLTSGTNPIPSDGNVGDYLINTNAHTIFGPKTTNGWGLGISLVGPAGPQGTAGTNGINGTNGATGPQGPQGVAGATGPQGLIGFTGPQGLQGATGATGPQGVAGATGPQGPTGTNGLNGTNGNTVLNGKGIPAAGIGSVGDLYLDTASNNVYGPKSSNGWGIGVNLVGPKGISGIPAFSTYTPLTNDITYKATNDGYVVVSGAVNSYQNVIVTVGTNQSELTMTFGAAVSIGQGVATVPIPAGYYYHAWNAASVYWLSSGNQTLSNSFGTLISGSGAPATNQGVLGDLYYDTHSTSFYGPKTTNGWGSQISVVGPQGPQGPIGLTGPAGTNGSNGATGPQGPQGLQGIPGATGATGPQGPAGAAAVITNNSVSLSQLNTNSVDSRYALASLVRQLQAQIQIRDLASYVSSGGVTPSTASAVWDSFVNSSNGLNNSMLIASPQSYTNNKYYSFSATGNSGVDFSFSDQIGGGGGIVTQYYASQVNIINKINSINFSIYYGSNWMTAQGNGYLSFVYTDGSSNKSSTFYINSETATNITIANPDTSKVVSNVQFFLYKGGWSKTYYVSSIKWTSQQQVITIASVNVPNITNFMCTFTGDRVNGGAITYALSNSSTTMTNLQEGTPYPWSDSNPPTGMTISLTPPTNSTTFGFPTLSSYLLNYNF